MSQDDMCPSSLFQEGHGEIQKKGGFFCVIKHKQQGGFCVIKHIFYGTFNCPNEVYAINSTTKITKKVTFIYV